MMSAQRVVPAPLRASVVIATYNRRELVARLLEQLGRQSLSPDLYEVVVVDDGSQQPVNAFLESLKLPYRLKVIVQKNGGAASARHRGVLEAEGEILIITDDDMEVGERFLEEHLKLHVEGSRRVVLGWLKPASEIEQRPLFERWYARRNNKLARDAKDGKLALRGPHLYTGNVSMRRADYLAVGGFDAQLKRSEDAELGLRLEKAGLQFCFSAEAYSLHGSDLESVEVWLRRALLYGVYDSRISNKHPDLVHANPWRFIFLVPAVVRPLLGASVALPKWTQPLSNVALKATVALDKLGLERAAFAGSSIVYAMQYFRGVREEAGSLTQAVVAFRSYLKQRGMGQR